MLSDFAMGSNLFKQSTVIPTIFDCVLLSGHGHRNSSISVIQCQFVFFLYIPSFSIAGPSP